MFADYPEIIKSISVPTMIIHGSEDPYIPLSQTKRMNENIQNSEFRLIDNASHFLPIDTPGKIADIINEFI